VLVRVVVAVMVLIGARELVATTGNETPTHLSVVFEKTQQVSVEFGELAAQ
jgi:hypothetical protein